MIRFDSLPVDVQQAMCTPMHRILPPAPATPATNATHSGSLYLGSMAALYDPETLRAHNITNIVQVLDAPWYPFLSSENLDGVYRIDILDQSSADLKPHLEMACDHIGTLLNQGKNVLVHCQQGISRSASIVIAYLIRNCGMSYDSAFAFVKRQRACIKPNAGFVKILREWEDQWHHEDIVSCPNFQRDRSVLAS